MTAIEVEQPRKAESLESVRFALKMLAGARLLCPLSAVDEDRYYWLGQRELALLGWY